MPPMKKAQKEEGQEMEDNPPAKRSKKSSEVQLPSSVLVRFANKDGEDTGAAVDLPFDSTPKQLELLINSMLGNAETVIICYLITIRLMIWITAPVCVLCE